jgi:hypothetical protein
MSGRGGSLRLRITKSSLRVVMSREAAPPMTGPEDDVLIDLFHSPDGGWWAAGVRVADTDDEVAEYLRNCLRRFPPGIRRQRLRSPLARPLPCGW